MLVRLDAVLSLLHVRQSDWIIIIIIFSLKMKCRMKMSEEI